VSPIVWIILGVVAVIVIGGILIYNGLVQRRLRIREAFAQIEVQLKRRWDLIPNLVNAVKGYMGFEQSVLENVTQARANAVSAGAQGPAQQAAAENALTGTLRSLFAVVENYPDLKANQNVLELQEQLTTTENQIGFARQHYNAVVLDYNTSIATIPNVLIAGPLGFRAEEFFDAEPEASQVPRVDLSTAPNVGLPPTTPPGGTLPPGGLPPTPPPAG
jgi:LemA protein